MSRRRLFGGLAAGGLMVVIGSTYALFELVAGGAQLLGDLGGRVEGAFNAFWTALSKPSPQH